MKVAINGGTPTTLIAGRVNPAGMALDATHVYWIDEGSTPGGRPSGTVLSIPKGGGTPLTLASSQIQPTALALDASSLYWGNAQDGTIRAVPFAGGTITTISFIGGSDPVTSLAADATSLYWTTLSNIVVAGQKSGGAANVLASYQDRASDLSVSGSNLYWTDYLGANAYEVLSLPVAGGTPATLAAGNNPAGGLATDGSDAYWTSAPTLHAGVVERISVNGGTVATIAAGQYYPLAIAVDATSVYWVNGITNDLLADGSFAVPSGSIVKATPR